jgi:hypothetical protein
LIPDWGREVYSWVLQARLILVVNILPGRKVEWRINVAITIFVNFVRKFEQCNLSRKNALCLLSTWEIFLPKI